MLDERPGNRGTFAIGVLFIWAASARVEAITISIDYSLDVRPSFFDTPEKKASLRAAAQFFEKNLTDPLDAIDPDGNQKTWTANVMDPNTGRTVGLPDLFVPADTLIIYAGARDLAGNTLGHSLKGLSNVTTTFTTPREWRHDVKTRGVPNSTGVCAVDYALWGGSLTFDTTESDGDIRKWNFDFEAESDLPGEDEYHLFSVALHEIGHLLGLERVTFSWTNWVEKGDEGDHFSGPASMAVFGNQPVPLDNDSRHWAEGTMSTVYPTGETQEAAMVSNLPAGTRRWFTHLDVAALHDVGWDIAQLEPLGIALVGDRLPRAQLQAGDANQDLKFDQLDVVRVLAAAKYLSGQPSTWGDGDWDRAPGGCVGHPIPGNRLFDQLDIVAALRSGLYLAGPYGTIRPRGLPNDAQTSLVYDARTGEVTVDAPAGIELTSINVDSAAGIFTGAPAENLGGSFDNYADANIFKATFGSSFGSISFGNVAQPGLEESFLLNDLTVIGSLAGGGDLGGVDLIYIPEPSGLVIVTLGVLALIGHAKRVRILRTAAEPKT